MKNIEKIKELEEELARLKGISNTSKLEERDIPFTSLTTTKLNLQTGKIGESEPEEFFELGETREIDYKTAREIVRNKYNRNFIRNGWVWIGDPEFIKKEHLNLKNILNVDQLKELANEKNRDKFESKFRKLTTNQKQTIVNLIYKQIDKNKHDMNIVNIINNELKMNIIERHERIKKLISGE